MGWGGSNGGGGVTWGWGVRCVLKQNICRTSQCSSYSIDNLAILCPAHCSWGRSERETDRQIGRQIEAETENNKALTPHTARFGYLRSSDINVLFSCPATIL